MERTMPQQITIMKRVCKFGICVLIMCSLISCIKVKEHIIINKDGSGKVIIETQADLPLDEYSSIIGAGRFDSPDYPFAYPPVTKEFLSILFPGDSFRIKDKKTKEKKYAMGTAAEIEFADINNLLASPYGKSKSLEVTRDEKNLSVRARTGLEMVIFGITSKDTEITRQLGTFINQGAKKKSEMSFEFKITLPEKPLKGNGQITDLTSGWTIDYATLKDDDKLRQESMKIMSVSCASANIAFSPITPPRLALDNFQKLAEQETVHKKTPSRDKITSAVKFIPHKLVVKRSIDISGEEYGGMENYGLLSGVIIIPKQFAPQKWGKNKLLEITDDLGNSLMPSEKKLSWYDRYSRQSDSQNSANAEYEQHPVSFSFIAPDRAAQMLSKFKGEAELIYSSGVHVIKIDKAISKNMIRKAESFGASIFRGADGEKLKHPGLAKTGMDIIISEVMLKGDMLMIFLESEKSESSVIQVQVFDAHGSPLPTLNYPGMNESSEPIMVMGKPEAPLSLALMVSVGNSVRIPVELKDISLKTE